MLRLFRELWAEHFKPETVRIARAENGPEVYRENGERCLTNYYRRFYPFDGDQTLGLEQRVSFSLDAVGAYRVQGVIDRVVRARDGVLEIHDFKTAQRVPSQQILDRDRQLALYQIGVAEMYGAEQPIRLVWHYLLRDQVRTSTRSPEALEDLREHTIQLIDAIRSERNFEPRPSVLCGWCEFAEICPASGRQRARPARRAPPPPPDPAPSALAGCGPLRQWAAAWAWHRTDPHPRRQLQHLLVCEASGVAGGRGRP